MTAFKGVVAHDEAIEEAKGRTAEKTLRGELPVPSGISPNSLFQLDQGWINSNERAESCVCSQWRLRDSAGYGPIAIGR